MDVSTFFLNWKRLWAWVVTPLILRLVITFAAAYFCRPAEEELSRTKLYSDAIKRMELIERKQSEIVEPFVAQGGVPFQEYFLTEISFNSKRADVKVDTSSEVADIKGAGRLQKSSFFVNGNAASLHEISLFLDLMMAEPATVVTSLDIDRQGSGVEQNVNFEVTFERVDVKAKQGKV